MAISIHIRDQYEFFVKLDRSSYYIFVKIYLNKPESFEIWRIGWVKMTMNLTKNCQ